MMPLVDGAPAPGESWAELAEHSLTHDDLTVHWHLASERGGRLVEAPHVRTSPRLRTSAANPLGLRTVPCTGQLIETGPHAGRCANHAGRFGWVPEPVASLPESRNAVD